MLQLLANAGIKGPRSPRPETFSIAFDCFDSNLGFRVDKGCRFLLLAKSSGIKSLSQKISS